ncbi:MAG TPA: DUF1684 domain-containing protein [Cyclobacteriaceae bacterium]|nr:DUF1684 domain-containing protein [Cyclobacteriaceae bacterium]
MKVKSIIIIGIVLIAVITIYYSFSGNENSEAYVASIQKLREEKDNTMRSGADSPFANDSLNSFKGLNYFPIDAAYRIQATLTPIENKKAITLPTSDEKQKSYLEYAYAEFEMQGQRNKLLILEIMDMGPYRGTLFLAFADKTSAVETYGAGRYLDIKKVPGSTSITLDFNEAYNPYCAYNDNYSCPFPPPENILDIRIEAGEKIYH